MTVRPQAQLLHRDPARPSGRGAFFGVSCFGVSFFGVLVALLAVALPSGEPRAAEEFSTVRYGGTDPLVSAPGVSASPLAGIYNPAAWPIAGRGGLHLGWDDPADDAGWIGGMDETFRGVLSLGALGFGMERRELEPDGPDRYDYTVGAGWGDRSHAAGVAYGWTRGAESRLGERERIVVGSIHRWHRLSLGLQRTWVEGVGDDLYQADLGVRPLGPRLTVFADASKEDEEDWEDLTFGVGAEGHLLPGVTAALRFQPERDLDFGGGATAVEAEQWSFRLEFSPAAGVRGSVVSQRTGGDASGSTYGLDFREGPHLGQWLGKPARYPSLELRGPVAYQTYRLFDERTRLLALLDRLARYAEDPMIGGVVVEMSGLSLSPAGLWELRAQLASLRAEGKKVIVHFDRLGFAQYAFATVADQIWMDPFGSLDLRGIHLGRTYYKRALDRAGLGFDELRFFTYKSAVESFSRTSLSDADREQLGALLDDFYEESVAQVLAGRGIDRAAFQTIVDERGFVLPTEALELGLVDSLGTVREAREAAAAAPVRAAQPQFLATLGAIHGDPIWSSEDWGEPPTVAVLYAIGPCEMDSGIRGRELARAVAAAREDRRVRAVVLRVDSPGGDPLPSDLVARELRETAKKKPVFVSQGQVAASGGYWLSMYGDEILVSPYTITGSIGVILAHVWDDSLGAKVGWDYEGLSRGRSADVDRGPVVPLVGASLPHRPLTPEERARAEVLVRDLYGGFVAAVAEGRDMEEATVDALGQGRVWSGRAGVANGLADEVGGLWDTIARAKSRAGLGPDRAVTLAEGPSLGWLPGGLLSPRLLGFRTGASLGRFLPWAWKDDASVDPAWATGVTTAGATAVGVPSSAVPAAGGVPTVGALPALVARLGSEAWASLSEEERRHLGVIDAHLGRPLVLAPPLLIEDGMTEP
jgi:protease-4